MVIAPAYEFTDDPTAFLAESRAHARRWNYAGQLVAALIAAAHAYEPEQRQPTRETYAAHLASVAHFAAIVSRARANAEAARVPLRIAPSLLRGMSSRGVLLSEVSV